jgi:hypothetical protein
VRRHHLDLLSLLFGLLFAGVGLVLLGGSPARGSVSLAWVGPVVAIGLGILVVVAARARADTPPDEEASAEE